MFDRYVGAKTQKTSKGRALLFGVSALLHAGGILGLLLWSFWQVDKVVAKYVPVTIVDEVKPPPPPAAAAPLPPVDPTPKPRTPKPPHDPAQPKPVPTVDTDSEPETPASEPDPDPHPQAALATDSDPDGKVGGTGLSDGKCSNPPCAVVEDKPVVAQLAAVEAQRISGTREIPLPADVKQQLGVQGIRQVSAMVKLCLSAGGAPTRVDVVASTGFPAADAKIRAEMGDWRYRPYTVNGRAVPVCTQVLFRYQIE